MLGEGQRNAAGRAIGAANLDLKFRVAGKLKGHGRVDAERRSSSSYRLDKISAAINRQTSSRGGIVIDVEPALKFRASSRATTGTDAETSARGSVIVYGKNGITRR